MISIVKNVINKEYIYIPTWLGYKAWIIWACLAFAKKKFSRAYLSRQWFCIHEQTCYLQSFETEDKFFGGGDCTKFNT